MSTDIIHSVVPDSLIWGFLAFLSSTEIYFGFGSVNLINQDNWGHHLELWWTVTDIFQFSDILWSKQLIDLIKEMTDESKVKINVGCSPVCALTWTSYKPSTYTSLNDV